MTEEMPFLDITKEQLERLANETVNEGLTVPGVQKKLSECTLFYVTFRF